MEGILLTIDLMPHFQIPLDPSTLKPVLGIAGGLLLITMVRIAFLMRTNNRLHESASKIERLLLTQHQEIQAVKRDSNAWRDEIQRVFDAFRAEFSMRISESELRCQEVRRRREQMEKAATPPPPAVPVKEPAAEKNMLPVPSILTS